jgi:membrane-associated phospholipid phosphatase
MKMRRKLMLCILSFPALAAAGTAYLPPLPSPPPPYPGTVLDRNPYPTQQGTHELPPRYTAPSGVNAKARLAYWSEQAWRCATFDISPPPAGAFWYAEQKGRTRSSRVMAIFHIAIYDAVNAIYKRYPGYVGSLPAYGDSLPDAAIAQAAHDVLVALYTRQAGYLDATLKADLARLPDGRAKQNGIDIGRRAAAAILALRANDGSNRPNPIVGETYPLYKEPGLWRPDPVSGNPVALGAWWGYVKPFVLPSVAQFRPPPPPSLGSDAYARDFNEVKQLGGDGKTTPTRRTEEQTRIGIFWGYDDAAWLDSPIRMYNQIGMQLVLARAGDPLELARVLALLNVAMADSVIAGWDAKYYYRFWRPVHAVREASPGTGPTGKGDGNPYTQADPNWTPLGAPASNMVGPDFTPAFPSYPSGHAVTGASLFQILRKLYGDRVPFTFVSDEWNGVTRDNEGWVRPRLPRSYSSLSQAEEEAGQSRIYLGVHFRFDKVEGAAVGHRVADYVLQRGLVRPDQSAWHTH